MATFTTQHTARKIYDCATCTGKIQPGERYSRTAIPPGTYDWGDTSAWMTYITHLTPGQCFYEDQLLQPGEKNPCAIESVTPVGSMTEGPGGTLLVDCACGEAFSVPQGEDEGAAITAAFAAHVRELEADLSSNGPALTEGTP